MSLEDVDDTELDELVVEFLAADPSEREATLERLSSAHPSHSADLRRRVALLGDMGMLEGELEELGGTPQHLGEFRLGERLGQGGMGVVYRAHQPSLGRDVALKLVRPEQLWFDGARERFQREVATVARLSHPGFVPVHAVGEGGGMPYFAMELVRGCTLAQALARLSGRTPRTLTGRDLLEATRDASGEGAAAPGDSSAAPGDPGDPESVPEFFEGSWVEVSLRAVRAIAEALEHAHRSGVLHRDIKPSNVMITPEGRVMLLDFGLSSEEQGTRDTRTGSHAGSLAYMAPELLAGEQKPSRRSDVYGLGVTLYELLTLHLPFEAGSAPALRAAIVEARTDSVRAHNASVSWEAQTVCQAALERDPGRRYATAADMALDLSNVLEGRPIVARRPGPGLRTRRFLERHPVATVATLVLLVSAPLTWGLQEQRTSRALGQKNVELERALTRADTNFQTAVRAVDELLTAVGERALADQPGMGELRRELLEQAAGFYEGFLEQYSGVDFLDRELASAWFRTGVVRRDLGEIDAALEAFERQAEIAQRQLASDPEDAEFLTLWARSQLEQGEVMIRAHRFDAAEQRLDAAVATVRGLMQRHPETTALQGPLGECLLVQAGLYSTKGEEQRSGELLAEAIGVLAPFVEGLEGADWLEYGNHLVNALWARGRNRVVLDRPEEARAPIERGLALLEELRAVHPESVVSWSLSTRMRNQVAALAYGEGRIDEALEAWRLNQDELTRLGAAFPGLANHEDTTLTGLLNLGTILTLQGELDEALAYLYQALELCEALQSRRAMAGELAISRAKIQGSLAGAHAELGEATEAWEFLDEALVAMHGFRERFPERPGIVDFLVEMHEVGADLYLLEEDHDAAADECAGALELGADLDADQLTDLVWPLGRCVVLAQEQGDGEGAAGHVALLVRTLHAASRAGAALDDLLERAAPETFEGHPAYAQWLEEARRQEP